MSHTEFSETLQHKSRVVFLYSLPDNGPFEGAAARIESMTSRLAETGVECIPSITPRLLGQINGYEIVIVMAHHVGDRLILADDVEMTEAEFTRCLPEDFNGILDLSSCHSSSFAGRVKEACPDCHVLAALQSVTLDFRLAIYPVVLGRYLDKSNTESYRSVFALTMKEAAGMLAEKPNKASTGSAIGSFLMKMFAPFLDLAALSSVAGAAAGLGEVLGHEKVKLGHEATSVFAPSAVEPDNPFLVQLFIHRSEDSDTVVLAAQKYDPDTNIVETTELPVRLKRGDRLAARLSFRSPQSKHITIDGETDTKTVLWTGQQAKIQFCACVDAEFSMPSFMARLQLEVNSQPVGDCYFKIKVERHSDIPAGVVIKPYSGSEESLSAAQSLKETLSAQEKRLIKTIEDCRDISRKDCLQSELNVCRHCLRLVDTVRSQGHNSPKKVFISSTSDLQSYRDVLRAEIMRCEMYPEMYENWAQTSFTPRDECFRRVLASDAVVMLLGMRYGFVEHSLGMSMTELEYRAALLANKPLLVFVMRPPQASDEPKELIERQNSLIEEVCTKRILKFFSNTNSLARIAAGDIIRMLS